MNPAQDALYRIHQFQASHRGQSALPYDQFCARVRTTTDTDLTGLLLPPTEVRIEIIAKRQPKFSLGQLCITPRAAAAVLMKCFEPSRPLIDKIEEQPHWPGRHPLPR